MGKISRPKMLPDNRYWDDVQVAARLNRSYEWFRKHRAELTREGFPEKDRLFDGWDSKAVEIWLDARSGIGLPANDAEALALQALHGKRAS